MLDIFYYPKKKKKKTAVSIISTIIEINRIFARRMMGRGIISSNKLTSPCTRFRWGGELMYFLLEFLEILVHQSYQ